MMKEKTYKKALSLGGAEPGRRDKIDGMSAGPPASAPQPHVHEFVDRVVVARPRRELFAFWRNFTNAPKFMAHVEAVTEVDSLSSMWTVKDGAGHTAQWEMLVTDEEADRFIAWSTSGKTPVTYSGRIEFQDAPGDAGTEITATVRHEEHAGLVETLIEAVAGSHHAQEEPLVQSRSDLARFKEYMEGRPDRAE